MSDIVERLMNAATEDLQGYAAVKLGQLLGEAAEEIERLRANLAALEDEKNAYIDYVGDALQQQVDALKAKNERLKRYIQDDWEHSDMCASHDLLGAATDNCNCGLRETLKALAGKEAG